MSFDPRIIPADDAPLDDDGSLLLPDDLSELANQLRDDASYLSSLYPAKPAHTVNLPAVAKVTVSRSSLITAASLLLLIGGNWLAWNQNASREPAIKAVTVPVASSEHASAEMLSDYRAQEPSFPVSFEPNFAGLLLYEYSGPELEGVFDLLDESPQEAISF